ncbi:MAG TPA: hypothetical protein VN455_13740 [Methanotrichaceae archaeon]|nr:hypothetical protein [Methanotrichaceae archaeon]
MIFIAVAAMVSTAGAVHLAATGTTTVTGTAFAHGDIFAEEITANGLGLYSGVWAHAYVPPGTDGNNSADSERTVPARTETRTFAGADDNYLLNSTYGESTVIAKASKTGVLGSAEAFSEISSLSSARDVAGPTMGEVSGNSQLVAYVQHSGTGTAQAAATGSATHDAMMSTGQIDATGTVVGSAAVSAANNYGGSVTGIAWKGTASSASSVLTGSEATSSQSFEYLYLTSGRNALSAVSDISGIVAGDTSGSGFYALTGTPGRFGNTASSATGDLSGNAITYKLGDSITPGTFATNPVLIMPLNTYLEAGANRPTTERGLPVGISLWSSGIGTRTASALLLSMGTVTTSGGTSQTSSANTESYTSAGATRTLEDANVAYGASFIDNGALSAISDTASAPGASPITIASASLDTIFMGSGAHLVTRLTGATPQSAADFTIASTMTATSAGAASVSTGSVVIAGNADPAGNPNSVVKTVGPNFSPTGTSDDATGSYLTALNIDGTATHARDTIAGFTSSSTLIADDISEVNIWSWIEGSDPRIHAESASGLTPFVATPIYTVSPATLATGQTSGPTTISGADATSRSVDTIFRSSIGFTGAA